VTDVQELEKNILEIGKNKMIKEFQKTRNIYTMDILNDKEIERLVILGKNIQADLSCDVSGDGFPCRTDRMSAVQSMKEYLSIHKEK